MIDLYDERADDVNDERPDYAGDKPYVETCIFLIGYWKDAPCGDPAHKSSPFCLGHSIVVARQELEAAKQANDAELIHVFTEDLAELGVTA